MAMRNSSWNLQEIENSPNLKLLRNLIKDCFNETLNHSNFVSDIQDFEDGSLWCPRTFDGFACWDETPAGAEATQPCPGFIMGFDPSRYAFKQCTENGTWFVHPDANKSWTNYTTCIDMEDLGFRDMVNHIYVIGYYISVAALLISLMIFCFFRTLRCTRIRVHMHLFSSFALNNILWIVWYKTVVFVPSVVRENTEWCQILHIITNYFMVTSYIWMFCEGLHLHISLVVVFVKEKLAMLCFIALGWGLPLVILLIYSVVRYLTPGATERCWMDHSDAFWIIIVPVVASLLASVVFLINVVRVLLTKLHAPSQHGVEAAKKAVRAALILIPLFGLHFILIPLRPHPGEPGEKAYQVVSAIITSLQGLCVAILFCFTNHDVIMAVKTQFSHFIEANDGIAMTGFTGAESMVNTRENNLP